MYKSKKIDEGIPISIWGVVLLLIIFAYWSPFKVALFNGNLLSFERPLNLFFVICALLTFLVSLFFFSNMKKYNTSIYFIGLIWLIPISSLLSLVNAASPYSAVNSLFIHIGSVAFFMGAICLASYKKSFEILKITILSSGYTIVGFGLLNVFGLFRYTDAVMIREASLRLSSVFQYPNTYAGFLIGFILACIYILVSSKSLWIILINSIFLYLMTVSFLMTLSRGALVIFPIIFLFMLTFLVTKKQIIAIAYLVCSFLASVPVMGLLSTVGLQIYQEGNYSLNPKGWAYLFIGIASMLVISYLIFRVHLLLDKKNIFKNRFVLPSVSFLTGMIGVYLVTSISFFTNLLPEGLRNKVQTINLSQNSVLERTAFYKDAFKIFKDYPFLGTGGGGWSALYEQYQGNPYLSRQVHNFYMQFLLENGLLGFVILAAFLLPTLIFASKSFYKDLSGDEHPKSHFIFFIIAIAILVHSVLDFNMTFAYIETLVFICLGALVPLFSKTVEATSVKVPMKTLQKVAPFFLLIVSVITLFVSVRLLSANSNFITANDIAKTTGNYNEIIKPLNTALQLRPAHPEYNIFKINMLYQLYNQTKNQTFKQQADTLLTQIKEKEPNIENLYMIEINQLLKEENYSKALTVIDDAMKKYPWNINYYEQTIVISFELGTRENETQRNHYWNQALQTFNTFEQKLEELKNLPEGQAVGNKPFEITQKMGSSMGQIYYLKNKDYAKSAAVLKHALRQNLNEQYNRYVARWYLASLKKQNLNDQNLYDQLVNVDPTEKNAIDLLLNQ